KNECLQPTFFIKDCDLLIVHGSPENVGCGVDVRVHEASDRAYGWGWGGEDTDLRQHISRVDYFRETRRPGHCNPGFEEGAPCCLKGRGVAVVGTTDMDCPGHTWPTAAISEFPSWKIGPAHRSPPESQNTPAIKEHRLI